MENSETVATFGSINFLHDRISRLGQCFLCQFIPLFKNGFAIITEKEFSFSHESANFHIRIFLHLAIYFFHSADAKIVHPIFQHVETDRTRFRAASFYGIQKESTALINTSV